jgi:cobaltochelatase CobN
MPKMFRMVFVSLFENEPDQLRKIAESVCEEAGLECDFFGIYGEDADEDVLIYHDLVQRTQQADFIYFRCMGDIHRFKHWDKFEPILKEVKGFPVVFSGNPEVNIMTRDIFRGTDDEYKELFVYAKDRCPENDRGVIGWTLHKLGFTTKRPKPAVVQRRHGVYHKGFSLDVTLDEYLKTLDPDKITLGVIFSSNNWIYGTLDHVDAIIEEVERQGMNSLPIFCSSFWQDVGGEITTVLSKYFIKDGKPLVSAIISTARLAIEDKEHDRCLDEWNFYRNHLNVPLIFGLSVQGKYHDFEDEKIGLAKKDMQMNVIYPELEGCLIGVPIAYKSRTEGTSRYLPIPDRIEHIVSLTAAWGKLYAKPKSERKIAILMWQSRPDSGNIGGAAGLDTPESVADMLKRFSSEGYTVENVPEDGRQLIDEILNGVTNDLENMSPQTVRERAVDLIPESKYKGQFVKIPAWDQEQMIEAWGQPPGEICVDRHDIIVPGIIKGNVFIGYQPLRGWADKMEQNLHDPVLFAQHQYLAYYRWLKYTFGADMIFHMGTHGSIEWLPGKNVGLSQKCDPEIILDGIPNMYPYIIDDPGEGIQCKRRIESVLLGHMPPTMARADSYPELDEVNVQLQDLLKLGRGASEDRRKHAIANIYEAAKRNDLLNDLGIPEGEDPGPEGFEEYIIPLHEYIEEVKDALVRSDLHVLGRVPKEGHFDEMIYSLTRLNNGSIMSLRDAFAFNQGFDIQAALEAPAEISDAGEINSVAIDRINKELMELLVWMREDGYDLERTISHIGDVSEDLRRSLEFVCQTLVPNINRMTDEVSHMCDGLNGEHVVPGPAGAPTRGGANILPMGRNFFTMDPDTIPTKTAWDIGKRMADQMIQRHVDEKGEYPREIGMVIWATDIMKTSGDDVAYILWLLGVRPIWARTGGQVVDLEVVPLSELGRPRVDVTVNITGLFRDTFPNLIDFIDKAVNMVIGLDEKDEDNALAANLRKDVIEGILAGLSPDEARRRNAVRIFGAPPGGYGTGVNKAVEASSWDNVQDLADVYLDWCSNGYSQGHFGEKLKDEFVRRFSNVEVTVKNMPDREIDLLDCDDVYEYLGGMNSFVRAYGKHKDTFSTFMGDDSDPNKSKIRSTQQELRYAFRSKVLNPKFINGLKEHGYRGAGEMANLTEFTMAWGATSDISEGWMYEGLADKFLFDKDTKEWMLDVNPYAMMNIINRLEEAISRGLWDATDEYKDKLKDLYLDVEERIEEVTDRNR